MTLSTTNYVKLLLATGVYVFLARIGLLFGLFQHNVTLFWPAGGFGLAVLLLGREKYIPTIFIGAYLAGMLEGDAPPMSLTMALGNGLESWAAYRLLQKTRFSIQLDRRLDYSLLILVAMTASTISAIAGVFSLWHADWIAAADLPTHFLRWWMADVLGIVFMTPLILFWHQPSRNMLDSRRKLELAVVALLIVAVVQVVFWDGRLFGMPTTFTPTLIWLMPLVIWCGTRLGKQWTATLLLMLFTLALWGSHLGLGYFGHDNAVGGLGNFWLFAMVASVCGVGLAIGDSERQALYQRLSLTQFAMDNAYVEIYWLDEDGHIHYANRQACITLDYEQSELQRLSIPDIDPLYSLRTWAEHWQQLKRDKTLFFETLHRRKDGSLFPVEVIANFVCFDGEEYNVAFCRNISARKKSEAKLIASEKFFHDLFDNSPDPCWIIENGRFIACNNAAVAALGFQDQNALLALRPAQLSPAVQPDGRSSQQKADEMMAIAQARGVHRFEWQHRRADGDCFPVEVTLSKIELSHLSRFDDPQNVLYCIWRDISEHKSLQRERERLARSVAASVNEIYMFDAETLRFFFVNNGALVNLGYTMDELKAMTPLDLKPAYTADSFAELLAPLRYHQKNALYFQTVHRRKQGEHYAVEVHLQLFEPADEPAYFMAIITDISEQQQLEAKLSTLIGNANAIIWSTDANLRVNYVSPGCLDILGIPDKEFFGKELIPMLESDMFHPNERDIQLQAYQKLLTEHCPIKNFSHRVRNARGDWQWASVSATPICDVDGKLHQIVGVVYDQTLQKQAEETLRNLNSELDRRVKQQVDELHAKELLLQQQSRMAAMGEMIGNIAHQWRQPLNSLAIVLMNIEDQVVNGPPDQAFVQDCIQRSNELLANMSQTIDDFRHFFRKDKRPVLTELYSVVRESVHLLESALSYHQIDIRIEGEQLHIEAMICPGELSQALLCLINNAKDQINQGKIVRGEIVIQLSQTPEWAMIRVSDNGGGIATEHLPKIFDPYFTTRADGNGLGLYITKLTIEQSMHGKIIAENTGTGACFTILLPYRPRETDA